MESTCWNIIHCIELALILILVVVIVIILLLLYKQKRKVSQTSEAQNNSCNIWMIISMVLSVAAFLSALFITHYCSYNTNACCDSNSVIVGAFGVIVTLLVGWQIYKTVDIDKKINKKIEGQDTRIESTEGSITTKAEELRSGFRKDIEQLKETIDMRGEFSAEKITMMVQELVNLGLSDKEIYGFVGKCIHTPTGYFIKALEKAREKPKEDN